MFQAIIYYLVLWKEVECVEGEVILLELLSVKCSMGHEGNGQCKEVDGNSFVRLMSM